VTYHTSRAACHTLNHESEEAARGEIAAQLDDVVGRDAAQAVEVEEPV
jgi:hypothetical protein